MSETDSEHGLLSRASELISSKVNESRLPAENYPSTVGIFGGKLKKEGGKMFYDLTGAISKVDRFGDPRLRVYDDHVLKGDYQKARRLHPKLTSRLHPWEQFKTPSPKRSRGNQQEMMQNVRRLGLEDYYGEHPQGIEIKRPEIYTKGIALQDILRADRINSPTLKDIDRFDALGQAARYVRSIHDQFGAIGELLPSDIIFQNHQPDGSVVNPVLNLPDIVYNPQKRFGPMEQRATDMLEFMVSVGIEELARTHQWESVKKALNAIVEGYGPGDVIKWTSYFAKRGRLTLDHPIFTKLHNLARLGIKPEHAQTLRQMVIEACGVDKIG